MIIKCEKGHWYDNTVYNVCPHCKRESEKLGFRIGDDVVEDDHTVSIAEVGASLGEELGSIIGTGFQPMDLSEFDEADAEGDRTISFGLFGLIDDVAPVVGWLVCVEGCDKGRDFRLKAGKNFIGRNADMDIAIVEDKRVTRDKHASVVYDPKSGSFFIACEQGLLTYHNGSMLNEPEQLEDGDVIEVGDTKLVFIPFCKGERTWEDTLGEEASAEETSAEVTSDEETAAEEASAEEMPAEETSEEEITTEETAPKESSAEETPAEETAAEEASAEDEAQEEESKEEAAEA